MRWTLPAFLLLCGCIGPEGGDTPKPSGVDALAKQAMTEYAERLSKSFGEAATAGHTDASTANTALAAANKAARQQAFAPLDAVLDDTIGGEKWDADKAAKLFKELSEAFGKAAK